jgi:transcriptional regulator with XRE-family HTH domain
MPAPRKLDPLASLASYFGAELRRLRERNGWTIEELADKLGWGLSTVASVETARRNPPYGLPERADTAFGLPEMLTNLAKLVRATPRWFEHYVDLEAQANKISIWATSLIPGLFQTEAYARAVIRAAQPLADEATVENGVRLRMERQSIIDRPDPPDIWVVIHEAAVKQPVADVETTRAQLRSLIDIAKRPNVFIQVLPYATAEIGGATGPFTIFGFTDEPTVVFAEDRAGGHLIDQEDELHEVSLTYDKLRSAALSPEASIGMIVGAMGQIWIDRI